MLNDICEYMIRDIINRIRTLLIYDRFVHTNKYASSLS
jgi:hypothetical protein